MLNLINIYIMHSSGRTKSMQFTPLSIRPWLNDHSSFLSIFFSSIICRYDNEHNREGDSWRLEDEAGNPVTDLGARLCSPSSDSESARNSIDVHFWQIRTNLAPQIVLGLAVYFNL